MRACAILPEGTMQEPSVLDYFKSKLTPWRSEAISIPAPDGLAQEPRREHSTAPVAEAASAHGPTVGEALPTAEVETARRQVVLPWKAGVSLLLGLAAQMALSPSSRSAPGGMLLYGLAALSATWSYYSGEWRLASPRPRRITEEPLTVRLTAAGLALLFALVAYLAFGGGLFTTLNVSVWLLAIGFFIGSVWLVQPGSASPWQRLNGYANSFTRPKWNISITRWGLLVLAVFAVGFFFKAYQLDAIPPEMNSDHAEKLLDVWNVLNGQTRIFFPRNTGREALQFYLTAAVAQWFGTGVSFLSLKIGALLAGLLALPFIYLLGVELGNRRAGLLAMAFAGVAYWPNTITRLALRFPLYPAFVAPTLYFLVRGLRRSNRNDFILSGIFLGIGLHGYTPMRIVPFLVVIAVGLYLLHAASAGRRKVALVHLALLSITALFIFLPLMRYAVDNPDMFAYRAMTRLGTVERPLPGPAWQIFLQNTWNAMIMFGWDNGEVWTVSIPHRPALDLVAAPLFYLGYALLFVRYLRRREWTDIFLLISVPFLMLPSILSLAFPEENPVLSRTGGAIVPVFVIVGLSLDGLMRGISERMSARIAWGVAVLLFLLSARLNYDLVFDQYYENYRLSSWNTSEMGAVIRDFVELNGSKDAAWVVGYPHWVDTRLVGINVGFPGKDYAIFTENLPETQGVPGAKLFLVKPEDQEAVTRLNSLYPEGWLREYQSATPTKNFLVFFVPPSNAR